MVILQRAPFFLSRLEEWGWSLMPKQMILNDESVTLHMLRIQHTAQGIKIDHNLNLCSFPVTQRGSQTRSQDFSILLRERTSFALPKVIVQWNFQRTHQIAKITMVMKIKMPILVQNLKLKMIHLFISLLSQRR